MVDDQPRRHGYNGSMSCYFPKLWHKELRLQNQGKVIPNISMAWLPIIFPLQKYNSIRDYLQENEMDGSSRRHLLMVQYLMC